jgi:hypothetical protein
VTVALSLYDGETLLTDLAVAHVGYVDGRGAGDVPQ